MTVYCKKGLLHLDAEAAFFGAIGVVTYVEHRKCG